MRNKNIEKKRWVYNNNRIILYKTIPSGDIRCSYCNGLDKNCPICKGSSIKKPKWYQFKKLLEYWLDNP